MVDTPELVAGRYEIVRELGRGGSATVYLAHDLQVERRPVALKALHENLTQSASIERFEREIRLMASLNNPHILPILDSGKWGERLFYVMKYIDGETLQARLAREGQLPLEDVLRIASEVCDALADAHAAGVIHRDVKPSNILVRGEHAWLTDFGVAKALDPLPGERRTTSGIAVGTMAYMSPEQAFADPRVDHRTDIYSLGCVLYEALAGVHPFFSSTEARIVAMRFTEDPQPLGRHRTGVPAHVEAALMKALEVEPANRWRGAREMAEGLGSHSSVSAAAHAKHSEVSTAHLAGSSRTYAGRTVLLVAAALASVASGYLISHPTSHLSRRLDWETSGIAILPLQVALDQVPLQSADVQRNENFARDLDEQLRTWRGIPIREVNSLHANRSDAIPHSLTRQSAVALAKMAGADLLITTQVQRLHSQLRVHLLIIDALTDSIIETIPGTVLEPGDVTQDTVVRVLAARLLRRFHHSLAPDAPLGTHSYPALRRYQRGIGALSEWDLRSAKDAFRSAAEADPAFAAAQYWLAQVLAWSSDRDADDAWKSAALAVPTQGFGSDSLTFLYASALADRARGDEARACTTYNRIVVSDSLSFRGWLGLGDCQGNDDIVLLSAPPNRTLRFRSTVEAAYAAYMRAMELVPESLAQVVVARARQIVPVQPSIRTGRLLNDRTAQFGALPSLQSGVLHHEPLQLAEIARSAPRSLPPSLGAALDRGRVLLDRMTALWTRRFPSDPAAHLARASTLELLGQLGDDRSDAPSATSELQRAIGLAATGYTRESARIRLVVLHLKRQQYEAAAELAETLLADSGSVDLRLLASRASIALLLGRADLAVSLMQKSPSSSLSEIISSDVPASLRQSYTQAFAYAITGRCDGALWQAVEELRREIDVRYDEVRRDSMLARIVTARIGLPAAFCDDRRGLQLVIDTTDVLARILIAQSTNDNSKAVSLLDAVRAQRRAVAPGDVSLEYSLHESLVLCRAGQYDRALISLTRSLQSLRYSGKFRLADPAQVAALTRTLLVIAELSSRSGSAEDSTFSAAAHRLWRHADSAVVIGVPRWLRCTE